MNEENQEELGIEQEGEVVIPPLLEEDIEEQEEETPEKTPEETPEETPFKVFKTEEEYQKFLEEQKAPVEKPKEELPEEDPRLWPDDWKPTNWNDFGIQLLKNPTARKMLAKEMSKEVVTEIRTMSEAERAEMDRINKEFDDEYKAIAKDGNLPDLSSDEGKVINQQISLVGATYGLTSITKAYELWKKLPKEYGGGYGYNPKKQLQDNRKQKAGLIGGGRKVSGVTSDTTKGYDDIHKKSLDELVQERTKE